MNKSELVDEVYGLLNRDDSRCDDSPRRRITKASAEEALRVVLEAIANGLQKDEIVQIVGFGVFSVSKRSERTGVNPRTGDKIQIEASKSIKFKAGAKLKEIL
ncbi:MAG: HU family DNA-binding protein [Puniceicoccales bacterium]|jgi:DNA-binding protein HU-beta|nr:HU family DNA-binding protein [Puniceicoccales bacterium]